MKQISVTRAELESLYRNNSARDACSKLGVTLYMFYKAIDKAGIARKSTPYKEQVSIAVID